MRLKHILGYCSVGVVSLALATPALAASVTGSTQVTLLKPMTIVQNNGMNFGTLTLDDTTTQSTATLTASSGREILTSNITNTDGHEAAKYTVSGSANETYGITIEHGTNPASPNTASSTVAVTEYTHNAGSTPQLDSSGNGIFYIGAKATVAAAAADGAYTNGTYTVTVDYQ